MNLVPLQVIVSDYRTVCTNTFIRSGGGGGGHRLLKITASLTLSPRVSRPENRSGYQFQTNPPIFTGYYCSMSPKPASVSNSTLYAVVQIILHDASILASVDPFQVQNPFFPFPASSIPSPTFLAPFSTPFPRASRASPTGLPALPVTPVTVWPTPRPAAPTIPPAVLATPETPFPTVEVTKLTGLLLLVLFEVGMFRVKLLDVRMGF